MTENLTNSRNEVMGRMLEAARARGGNAVIGMRFDTSEMGDTWTEICAYGTAVVAVPVDEAARQTAAQLGYGQPQPPSSSRRSSQPASSSRSPAAAAVQQPPAQPQPQPPQQPAAPAAAAPAGPPGSSRPSSHSSSDSAHAAAVVATATIAVAVRRRPASLMDGTAPSAEPQRGDDPAMASDEDYRIEKDSMGEVRVPAAAKWRAQTQRAVENFPISGQPIERELIAGLALIKGAGARVRAARGLLDQAKADAIAAAAARGRPRRLGRRVPDRRVPDRLGHLVEHERQRGAGQPGRRAARRVRPPERRRQRPAVVQRPVPVGDPRRRDQGGRARPAPGPRPPRGGARGQGEPSSPAS